MTAECGDIHRLGRNLGGETTLQTISSFDIPAAIGREIHRLRGGRISADAEGGGEDDVGGRLGGNTGKGRKKWAKGWVVLAAHTLSLALTLSLTLASPLLASLVFAALALAIAHSLAHLRRTL